MNHLISRCPFKMRSLNVQYSSMNKIYISVTKFSHFYWHKNIRAQEIKIDSNIEHSIVKLSVDTCTHTDRGSLLFNREPFTQVAYDMHDYFIDGSFPRNTLHDVT